MMLYLTLFLAGMLTILLPCILPLVPVVLGVSIAGKSRLRPFFTVLGMVVSFVVFTFVLLVLLNQFVELADLIRLATYAVLFLFGVAFLTSSRVLRDSAGGAAALFFIGKDPSVIIIAALVGIAVMDVASIAASRLQQVGLNVQNTARTGLGNDSHLTAFVIGMTLGLVWVPCAGPALGFALTLVRNQPGPMAALALLSYALGSAIPLLLVGYGGQTAVRSVRSLTRYTGLIKMVSGVLLLSTAILLRLNAFQDIQVWLLDHTNFGDIGTRLEEKLFPMDPRDSTPSSSSSANSMKLPLLPKLVRAPEFFDLGPWHNADPFTLESLKGKVVLVDFWTYSCINCIRTLPYIQGYWDKYKDTGKFVLLGVHTPEFTFEKSEENVAMAIKKHGLMYPVAQDNNFGTWSAFANRYWPAKYLIDANGIIRYEHFGEGNYEETDRAIASLLEEAGVDMSEKLKVKSETLVSSEARKSGQVTPETYLSSRSWPALGNSTGSPSAAVITYTAPDSIALHKYYLVDSWQLVADEAQTLVSDIGEVRMRFLGGEINLVMGLAEGATPVEATVTVDGKLGKTFVIDHHDLYNLFTGDYGEHDIVLTLKGKGLQAFAFTFGR